MSPRVSAEMKEAQRLLREGLKPYAAAKLVGLDPSAIYHSAVCKAILAEVREAKAKEAAQLAANRGPQGDLFAYEQEE